VNEAQEAYIAAASAQAARDAARKPIDYAEMNRLYPRQKSALTRAINSGDRDKLILAVRDAVRAWNNIGAWPDGWARWQRAVDDVLGSRPRVDIADLA